MNPDHSVIHSMILKTEIIHLFVAKDIPSKDTGYLGI